MSNRFQYVADALHEFDFEPDACLQSELRRYWLCHADARQVFDLPVSSD